MDELVDILHSQTPQALQEELFLIRNRVSSRVVVMEFQKVANNVTSELETMELPHPEESHVPLSVRW